MSFLDKNNSEYFTSRITNQGRKAIANGNFNIKYFTIGDSEFNYSSEFSGITGNITTSVVSQSVFAPLDKDSHIKYPLKFQSGSTIYGTPITGSSTEIIRNAIGPAGFVSYYKSTGTTVECLNNEISISNINGTNILSVTKQTGTTYSDCQYISLVFNSFGSIGDKKYLSTKSSSYVYKIISLTGATSGTTQNITLDRNLPDLSYMGGTVNVVCNKCEMEFTNSSDVDNECIPQLPDNLAQHNPWTLNNIWSQKPIGADVTNTDENLSGYTSNKFISVKDYLGYSTTGQTHINFTGGTVTGTTFKNSFNELIELKPTQQKCISLIHYSEIGDIVNDPDRFFKYDDYISTKTGITGDDISIIKNDDDESISDNEYFEIYIPFINYHRVTGSTIGAKFTMDTSDYYIKSIYDEKSKIKYRYLLDANNNKVGKVFVDKKVIVFDDEEIVAVLDYRSNRKYTLPAPKVVSTPSTNNTYLINSTGQTFWFTYVFGYSDGFNNGSVNSLPCNYFIKVTGTTTPSNVILKFNEEFSYISNSIDNISTKFIANSFYILAQETENNDYPNPDNWTIMDYTTEAGGSSLSGLTGTSFTITSTKFDGGTTFDLESHMGTLSSNYLGTSTSNDFNVLTPQFGDEQPFPGSVRLVRSSDIEVMKFYINLPNGNFTTSQNPTKINNTMNPMITEIALLNDKKDVMVMGKSSKPISRTGTQVFTINLDF